MRSDIVELEQSLIAIRNGDEQIPSGLDSQEAVAELRERLENLLMEDAKQFLEVTKDLSPNDQIVSWRNWLYSADGETYPWRQNVYCELEETPTQPTDK